MVSQVFNSKADLQHAAKLYSISEHQDYVVVESTTKLLVLSARSLSNLNVHGNSVLWF